MEFGVVVAVLGAVAVAGGRRRERSPNKGFNARLVVAGENYLSKEATSIMMSVGGGRGALYMYAERGRFVYYMTARRVRPCLLWGRFAAVSWELAWAGMVSSRHFRVNVCVRRGAHTHLLLQEQ